MLPHFLSISANEYLTIQSCSPAFSVLAGIYIVGTEKRILMATESLQSKTEDSEPKDRIENVGQQKNRMCRRKLDHTQLPRSGKEREPGGS